MNKNLLRTCIGLTVGGSLLITSTVMGMASGPTGYETLKAAFKNSEKIENATFSMYGSLTDNDREFMKVNALFKMGEQDESMSGTVSLDTDTLEKDYSFFTSKDTMVFKDDDSDVYNKITCDKKSKEKKSSKRHHSRKNYENPQMDAIGESIMDTLVGDFKNQVSLKNLENGEKQISINLEKGEIPALFNLMLNIKDDEESGREYDKNKKMQEILGVNPNDFDLPELTSNIEAEQIDIQMVVDENNIIKEMDFEFDVTGYDAQNQVRNQELKLSIDISGINSTTADTVDLNGKDVKEISPKDFDCHEE